MKTSLTETMHLHLFDCLPRLEVEPLHRRLPQFFHLLLRRFLLPVSHVVTLLVVRPPEGLQTHRLHLEVVPNRVPDRPSLPPPPRRQSRQQRRIGTTAQIHFFLDVCDGGSEAVLVADGLTHVAVASRPGPVGEDVGEGALFWAVERCISGSIVGDCHLLVEFLFGQLQLPVLFVSSEGIGSEGTHSDFY